MTFYVVNSLGLDCHRAGKPWDIELTDEDYDHYLETNEAEFTALLNSQLSGFRQHHAEFYGKVLAMAAQIQDGELDLPVRFWEEKRYSLRFRLHRFASHLRQHTIQVEKTLAALGYPLGTESQLLLRQVFLAWANFENAGLGAPSFATAPANRVAALATTWTQELSGLFAAS